MWGDAVSILIKQLSTYPGGRWWFDQDLGAGTACVLVWPSGSDSLSRYRAFFSKPLGHRAHFLPRSHRQPKLHYSVETGLSWAPGTLVSDWRMTSWVRFPYHDDGFCQKKCYYLPSLNIKDVDFMRIPWLPGEIITYIPCPPDIRAPPICRTGRKSKGQVPLDKTDVPQTQSGAGPLGITERPFWLHFATQFWILVKLFWGSNVFAHAHYMRLVFSLRPWLFFCSINPPFRPLLLIKDSSCTHEH